MHRILVGQRLVDPAAFWRLPPGQAWWIMEDCCPELFQDHRDDKWAELYDMLSNSDDAADLV